MTSVPCSRSVQSVTFNGASMDPARDCSTEPPGACTSSSMPYVTRRDAHADLRLPMAAQEGGMMVSSCSTCRRTQGGNRGELTIGPTVSSLDPGSRRHRFRHDGCAAKASPNDFAITFADRMPTKAN